MSIPDFGGSWSVSADVSADVGGPARVIARGPGELGWCVVRDSAGWSVAYVPGGWDVAAKLAAEHNAWLADCARCGVSGECELCGHVHGLSVDCDGSALSGPDFLAGIKRGVELAAVEVAGCARCGAIVCECDGVER